MQSDLEDNRGLLVGGVTTNGLRRAMDDALLLAGKSHWPAGVLYVVSDRRKERLSASRTLENESATRRVHDVALRVLDNA